jgi:hypothetical protein
MRFVIEIPDELFRASDRQSISVSPSESQFSVLPPSGALSGGAAPTGMTNGLATEAAQSEALSGGAAETHNLEPAMGSTDRHDGGAAPISG